MCSDGVRLEVGTLRALKGLPGWRREEGKGLLVGAGLSTLVSG